MPVWRQFMVAVATVVTASCAVIGAVRAGNWRKTEEAQNLLGRVGKAEADIVALGGRVDGLDSRIHDMPTKAELAVLEGEIDTVKQIGERTEKAVARIEGFLMRAPA